MATIHELSTMRKTADMPTNTEKFRNWYKEYLMLGRSKTDNISKDELAVALDTECDVVEALLPESGIESLHEGDDCKLCSDDGDVRHAELIATTDLGHKRENPTEHELFGTKHGHAVPVHISCCKRCKRNYRLVAYLPTFAGLILTIIAFLTLSDRNVREPLMAVFTALPVVVFLAVVGISMLVCALLRRFLLDTLGKKTKFDIFEIEKLHYMQVGGWVNIFDEANYSKLMFAEKLPQYMQTQENVSYNVKQQNDGDPIDSSSDTVLKESTTAPKEPVQPVEISAEIKADDEQPLDGPKASDEPKPDTEL